MSPLQVCSMKLLLDESQFDSDPEGLAIAAAVNAQLPASVRVFSAQRVNKRFNTRRWCWLRHYQYFLPASVMQLACDGGPEDSRKIAAMQAALDLYIGNKPFHNMAGGTEGGSIHNTIHYLFIFISLFSLISTTLQSS